ncbi:MAG TPA: C39 family peptidase [Longimicrobium sp.]|jgi:hypothetical protein|uniref:C39 family peptidase n=1 Tax=Longimicrobium sp. TaxID=2029185 RepID=UPI002EDB5C3B
MNPIRKLLLLVLLLLWAGPSAAQVWQSRYGMSPDAFQQAFDTLGPRGFVPAEIAALEVDGQVRYDAIWRQEPTVRWQSWHGVTGTVLQQKFDELAPQGFVPVVLVGYATREGTRFAAVWRRDADVGWSARFDMDAGGLARQVEERKNEGFAPVTISGYTVGGQTRYAAIWRKRPGVSWESRSDLTAAEFQAWYDRLTPRGYVPVDVSAYPADGQTRFAAIWERVSGTAWEARNHLSQAEYRSFTTQHVGRGYAPYIIAPYPLNGSVAYAGAWRVGRDPVVRPDPAATRDLDVVPAGTRSAVLPIAPVYQQTQVWCWLAVGEMLFRHYGIRNVNPAGNFQCGIIGAISDPSSPCYTNCMACIRPSGSNQGTLAMIANYAGSVAGRRLEYSEARVISPGEIVQNIDARRPIIAGISSGRRIYEADSEHVALIVGYELRDGTLHLIVNDPFPYASGRNPFLRNGGTQPRPYQYRIAYDRFRDGVFWHWSVFNISL